MELLEEVEKRIVCGDGAIGTLLLDAGISLERSFEELCISEPHRISSIHEQYISAGAEVIETNSFGANRVRLERFALDERVREINLAAAKLAVRSARNKNVCVAGSVGPLGITAAEAARRGIDRLACFREQIDALIEGGVDVIFLETFMDFEELTIALSAIPSSAGLPAICSCACAPEGRLSSGMLLSDAFAELRKLGAAMVGVNCLNGPHATVQLLQRIPADYPIAAYPNAGYPKYHAGRFIYHTAPNYFAKAAREIVAEGARLIGGCCGTNPRHVAAIAQAISGLQPVCRTSVRTVAERAVPIAG